MGTILALIVACVAARELLQVKVTFRPCNVADKVTKAKNTALGIVDELRLHLLSKAEREKTRTMRKAQMMYDNTVADIFENATDEEKQALLDLFAKYGQPQS